MQATNSFGKFIKKNGKGYLFILPFVVLFTTFVIVPVAMAFSYSVTYYNMLEPPRFIGLNNFKTLLLEDDIFLISLKNTFIFAVIAGPIGYIMSFITAWVINGLKCRNGFSLLFYAPSITSGVAMSVVWLYFFSNDRYGLFNNFLLQIGAIIEPVLWTLDQRTILPVVIVITIWMSMGNGFLVFLAGIQSLDHEVLEAGKIDGIKDSTQNLWYLVLPMMKPQLLFGAINSIVGSFGVFDVAVSVAGMPSPNYAAHTIVAHLYDYAFIRFEMGYASAVAVILFLITFILGRVVMRVFRSDDE